MPPQPGHDYFTNLPLETLQDIASYLSTFDKLKFRTLIPKHKEHVLVGVLGKVIENVYVSPTRVSLDCFQHIAESPFFSKCIRRVTYLPVALGEVGHYYPRYTSFEMFKEAQCPARGRREARKQWTLYTELLEEHEPFYVPACEDGPLIEDSVAEVLGNGLSRLPNLECVSITSTVQSEGLNATALWYNYYYAKSRIANGQNAFKIMDEAKRAVGPAETYEQLYAIFQAIEDSQINLRCLKLGEDRIFGRIEVEPRMPLKSIPKSLGYVLRRLRKLTVTCEDGPLESMGKTSPLWRSIVENANAIRDLVLHIGGAGFVEYRDVAKVHDAFLAHGNFPSLEKFELVGCKLCPRLVNTPLLRQFMGRHSDSLKEVVLHGVVLSHTPSETAGTGEYNGLIVIDGIKEFLKWAPTGMEDLQIFEMKLYRIKKYQLWNEQQITEEMMTKMAEKMGLSLMSNGEWDFGQAVGLRAEERCVGLDLANRFHREANRRILE
ncbi:hypothetical protein HII31_06366 [Pseudocercospora fuligena]|uniref:F-box domain-containing protein n=1 Tax=Pseudocercospora fuligena TaxID=685502 RepID=A0A8H6RJU0_9PEZI|nr:hypothetical protein HII31_06366 [Pseudocercospora fuligena]